MKSVLMSKKNLIASLSITKFLGNQNKISWRWSYRFLRWKIPKLNSNHTCLAVISLDSTFKKDDNYYPQVFLKKHNYIGKKVVRHINDDLSHFSFDDDESDGEQIGVD